MEEARKYTGSTYAESTKKSYRTHLRTYLRFCIYFNLDPVPIAQGNLIAYVAYLARTLKPSSIGNYINIIRLLHLESYLPNPLADNFGLKNVMKGIQRENGTPVKQMKPLEVEMLLNISRYLCMLFPKDIAFWAICCVGFFGFLRKATLLPISNTNPGDASLQKGDLEFLGNAFILHIRRTKTIQCNERVLSLVYAACNNSPLCPVQAVKNLLYLAPNDPSLPLFSYMNKGKIESWTHSSFQTRLRQLLNQCGYPAQSFSCHSFRRGGATLAFKLGMSMAQIKKRGDWRSSAVEQYVWMDERQDHLMASNLVHGASSMLGYN